MGSKTACGVGKGFVQALVPQAGVTPVTEIEVLHALNDPATNGHRTVTGNRPLSSRSVP